jgi:hypothetical protein
VAEFIAYLLRKVGSRELHIGDSGGPLCGVVLGENVERVYLPTHLGPSHGVCASCMQLYEREKRRLTGKEKPPPD